MYKFVVLVCLALAAQMVHGADPDLTPIEQETFGLIGVAEYLTDFCVSSFHFLGKELNSLDPANTIDKLFLSTAKEMAAGPLKIEVEASPEDSFEFKTQWYEKACEVVAGYKKTLESRLVGAKEIIATEHTESRDYFNTVTGIDQVNCKTPQTIYLLNRACEYLAEGYGTLFGQLQDP